MFVEQSHFYFRKTKSPDVSSFGVKSSATKCPHLILTLAAADFPNFPVFNTLKVFSSGCNLDYGTRLPRLLYPRKTQIHKYTNKQIHKYTGVWPRLPRKLLMQSFSDNSERKNATALKNLNNSALIPTPGLAPVALNLNR